MLQAKFFPVDQGSVNGTWVFPQADCHEMVGRDPLGGFDVKPRRWGVSEPCIISPASQDQYIRKAQTLGDGMPVQDEGPSNALPLELGFDGQRGQGKHRGACLLYTSPSPRD